MQNFQKRIEEIEAAFQTTDEKLRGELRGTEQALADARARAEALETRYKAMLLKGEDATKLRVELTVAQDSVALLTEMAAQIRQDLEAGEIVEAQVRKHAAVCGACEAEGNHAISQAIAGAEAARDAYKSALETLVTTQHRVADVGRRSVFTTSKTGRSCSPPTVARYQASEFEIETPSPSASAAPML
jgi:DNA repair exonuclease SbcCD ATPase subunit